MLTAARDGGGLDGFDRHAVLGGQAGAIVELGRGVQLLPVPAGDFEPHVAEQVLTEMLREAGVRVIFGQPLISVDKQGVHRSVANPGRR